MKKSKNFENFKNFHKMFILLIVKGKSFESRLNVNSIDNVVEMKLFALNIHQTAIDFDNDATSPEKNGIKLVFWWKDYSVAKNFCFWKTLSNCKYDNKLATADTERLSDKFQLQCQNDLLWTFSCSSFTSSHTEKLSQ